MVKLLPNRAKAAIMLFLLGRDLQSTERPVACALLGPSAAWEARLLHPSSSGCQDFGNQHCQQLNTGGLTRGQEHSNEPRQQQNFWCLVADTCTSSGWRPGVR